MPSKQLRKCALLENWAYIRRIKMKHLAGRSNITIICNRERGSCVHPHKCFLIKKVFYGEIGKSCVTEARERLLTVPLVMISMLHRVLRVPINKVWLLLKPSRSMYQKCGYDFWMLACMALFAREWLIICLKRAFLKKVVLRLKVRRYSLRW